MKLGPIWVDRKGLLLLVVDVVSFYFILSYHYYYYYYFVNTIILEFLLGMSSVRISRTE